MKLALLPLLLLPALGLAQQLTDKDPKPLTAEEQQKRFKVPPGFEVQLVADESQIHKPININFDAAGRIWVSGSHQYPWPAAKDAQGNRIPNVEKVYEEIANAFGAKGKAPPLLEEPKDAVRVLSDLDEKGRARKSTVFADKLNIPSGIQPLPRKPGAKGDSAIIYSIPNIWLMTDTDGDGAADKREVLYGPFGFLDTHGGSSSYNYWIDGWIYGTHGFRNRSEVKDRAGKVTVFESGNTYRFKPDGSKIEYWSHGQTNPFGLTFDPLGNLYSADCHSKPVYLLLRGGYYEGIGKQHDGLGFAPAITNDDHGSSGICGIAYYAAEQFPPEFRDNLYVGNCVTGRINRDTLEWHGSTPKAIRQPDFLTCDDPWFRPVDVKLGPDGALYIADFYNLIIGHYEQPLTDPRRDFARGRIWRVVWKGDAGTASSVASTNAKGSAGFQPAGQDAPPTKDAPIAQSTSNDVSGRMPETARWKRALPISHAMPDLTKLDAQGLVEKLGDGNLAVRTLATHELVERVGSGGESTWRPLIGGRAPAERQASQAQLPFAVMQPHLLWVKQRLHTGAFPDLSLEGMRRFSPQAMAAMPRVISPTFLRHNAAEGRMAELFLDAMRVEPPVLGRSGQLAALEFMAEHPHPETIGHLLALLASNPGADSQRAHATRVALRDNLAALGENGWRTAAAHARRSPDAAKRLADVSLAVPTAASADFLLTHLERTKLGAPRTGEFLRHVMTHMKPELVDRLVALVSSANDAPLDRRLAIADAVTDISRKRNVPVPPPIAGWIQRTLTEALSASDGRLLVKALAAVREAKIETKLAPVEKIVVDRQRPGQLRAAALEAIANLDSARPILATALADPSSMTLRKRAAELLGQSNADETRAALLAALPAAPWELATTIGAGLANNDRGAEQLLALLESGKASPGLLRNKAVAGPLEKRPQPLRDRAAALTKDLPPEDARLDQLIATRVNEFRAAKPDLAKGQQLFAQQCGACHRVKGVGGSIGPNLDGVGVRGLHRLVEDILDPNRNVDPAFRQHIIETNDGRTVAGVNLRTEGQLLMLNDVEGKEQSVPKAQVKSQTQSRLSLMPPAFEQTLSPSDLNDLVAYLISQTEK